MVTAEALFDALIAALLHAGDHNPADQVAPAAILWPDRERQWAPLLPELRQRLPLLTLGDHEPAMRTGPAYYLRCMIARALPEDLLPADAVPIIYLPGVSRQELRAIEECPKVLQPLAELQYRGVLWTHRNGRDWTVAGFLQNAEAGLNVAVASDGATRDALLRALPVLAHEPLAHLRQAAPLRAPFLDALLNPDPVRRLLLWMDDPPAFRQQTKPEEWIAFCQLCSHTYGFHPEHDGELAAVGHLGQPAGEWQSVWQRFLEAPGAYPNLPELLRRARPTAQMALFEKPCPYWPQDTESAEGHLRAALQTLVDRPAAEVRAAIYALEEEHRERRGWVWSKLGLSPLAEALAALARLAATTETAPGGADLTAIAEAYTVSGWQADAAALDALAAITVSGDLAAVRAALVSLYRPWLEGAALAFQQAVLGNPAKNYVTVAPEAPSAGTCIVFCDALRFDLAHRLVAALSGQGFTCELDWGLAALPTITPTAKPAVSPVADRITAGAPSLTPVTKAGGIAVNAEVLRKLLLDAGCQVLGPNDAGDPAGIAWTEMGAIDAYGHGHEWQLARHLPNEVHDLQGRISDLLAAGWKQIRVVTDHGWLLLPGGLPKANIPLHLTLERKGRCALLREGVDTDQPIVPWHWDHSVAIAVAPGIACYEAGHEYEHGGLSPQECVVPVITVSAAAQMTSSLLEIQQVIWRGLRCQIELSGDLAGVWVDIRSKVADPATSLVAAPKQPDAQSLVSLPVPDDERIGDAAFIVVYSQDGTLRAQILTTVGG